MSLKEQLAEKKAALKALEENIAAGEEEAIAQGEEIAEAIAEIERSIEAAEKAQALLETIGKEEEPEEGVEMNSMNELTAKAANIDKNVKGWSVGVHFKAATDVVEAPQLADIDRSVAPQPKRIAAADFFSNATISGNAITYFLQGAYEGTPANVSQGAKKPQNSTCFEPYTLPLAKLAAYIKETDEILWDADFLASEVQNSLLYRLGTVEDAAIVASIIGQSGVLSYTLGSGESLADGIISAIMKVKENSAYDASVVLMNPADFLTAIKAKDGNNQYYGGGYFSGAYGTGAYGVPTSIWGVPVFTTSVVTAGTAAVAAREAVKIWRKGGMDVKVYEQNEDDALYNRVTLLAEERLVSAVVDLNGVCTIA